jgi:hypothetical protein
MVAGLAILWVVAVNALSRLGARGRGWALSK